MATSLRLIGSPSRVVCAAILTNAQQQLETPGYAFLTGTKLCVAKSKERGDGEIERWKTIFILCWGQTSYK